MRAEPGVYDWVTSGGELATMLAWGAVILMVVAVLGLFAWWRARGQRRHAQVALRHTTAELARVDLQRLAQIERRRQAEASLRLLGKAVETMSLGVTVTNDRGEITYVNRADSAMHGYQVDELIGADASVYAAEGEAGSQLRRDPDDQPWTRERMARTKDGREFPVRLVSDPVFDDDGEQVAMVTICEDISERLLIRRALERREAILEAVGYAAERFLADPSWEDNVDDVLGRLGHATSVERVLLTVFAADGGDDPRDALVHLWSRPDSPFTRQQQELESPAVALPSSWRRSLEAGELVVGPVAEHAPSPEPWFKVGVRSVALVPLFVHGRWRGYLSLEDGDGDRSWSHSELEALRTAGRTVSASIQNRQDAGALADSEANYRDFLENATDLVQSVAPDGRFLFVNRAWKVALGYSDDEVSKLTAWDVMRLSAAAGEGEDRSVLLDSGDEVIEAIFVAKDGSEITAEGIVTSRYVDDQPVASQAIFRDITERRLIDQMKQEFLSTVSHELRTPLTSIIASLGLLDSGRLDDHPERVAEMVSVAHRNSNRLLKLINNLLDLQKLAARKLTFRRDPIDVEILLREAVNGIRAYAVSCSIELIIELLPDDLPPIIGDRDRLMQVLNNLLSNAIKFSSPGARVRLGASSTEGRVRLWIADKGPGIPEEFLGRLFDQFTQADPSTTRASGGSGLGLSIAKGLIEGMQGSIDLETEIDRGTTFFVDLPAAASPVSA